MILTFAGNRVDSSDRATARFPTSGVERVQNLVKGLLAEVRPAMVLGAAAAGADLIVLHQARRASIQTHIVLPLEVAMFREISVADREPYWVEQFDDALRHADELTIEDYSLHNDWYLRGNDLILDTAAAVAADHHPSALIIAAESDHQSATADFRRKVSERRWPYHLIEPQAAPNDPSY